MYKSAGHHWRVNMDGSAESQLLLDKVRYCLLYYDGEPCLCVRSEERKSVCDEDKCK